MELPRTYQRFKDRFPDIVAAYERLGDAVADEGPLDEKGRELIKLAIAIGSQSEGGVHSHTRRAIKADATGEEIEQIVLLSITSIGFARAVAACTWVNDVLIASD